MANWRVSVDVRMISTRDGHPFFTATGSRYSVDVRPAFSMMDIAINSALTLLQLRDVNLAEQKMKSDERSHYGCHRRAQYCSPG